MNKKEKIVDVILILILVISNIQIGTPLIYNMEFTNLIINVVAMIYLIINIVKKQKLELNKFDILVIVLSLTTFIPLITNSYLRLRFTLEYILRYITALNMYFIVRKYISEDKNKINLVANVIAVMSIILIVFGIDMICGNNLQALYDFIKVPDSTAISVERMSSIFKYANTFCIYIGISLFATIAAYLNTKNNNENENNNDNKSYRLDKIKKSLYANAIFMQIFAIGATFSRLGWIVIFALLLFYILYLKENRKEIIKLLVITGINAFIYFCIFYKKASENTNYIIWLMLVVQNIIQFLVFLKWESIKKLLSKILKVDKLTKKIDKGRINSKCIFLLITIILFALITITYNCMPNELVLFNSNNAQKTYRKQNIIVERKQRIYIFF